MMELGHQRKYRMTEAEHIQANADESSPERAPELGRDDCVVPPPVDPATAAKYFLGPPGQAHEAEAIHDYVMDQSPEEEVLHLEKVKTEVVYGRRYDVWDVHTDGERYWVVTSPINLYSQRLFPSLDYTLSFHIGLMARVLAADERMPEPEQGQRLAAAWRMWVRAAEALDLAEEAEDIQAVGMRCRECLLAAIQSIADPAMVPGGADIPKRSDFLNWIEHVANTLARGPSSEHVRGHVKAVARSTWQLANWLTHSASATLSDGRIAVDAVEHLLSTLGSSVVRFEAGLPERCPECASYRLTSAYRPQGNQEAPYLTLCASCGWEGARAGDRKPME